jgi:hypothetical protein
MLIASLGLATIRQGDVSQRLRLISAALAVGGLCVGGLGFLQAPLAAGAMIALIGGSTALFTPLVWAMLQELTPAHLLGRVFTSFATGGMASSMAGMAGFGWAADAIGPGVSLGGISLILLLTAVASGLMSLATPHPPAPVRAASPAYSAGPAVAHP